MKKIYKDIYDKTPSCGILIFNFMFFTPMLILNFPGFDNNDNSAWAMWIGMFILGLFCSCCMSVIDMLREINLTLASRIDELTEEIEELKNVK